MSQDNQTKKLSKWDTRRIRQFPCDGIPRYRSKRSDTGILTYSEAWADIIATSGSIKNDKNITFSKEAIRRLGNLNSAYIGVARPFIEEVFRQQTEALVLAKKKEEDEAKLAAATSTEPKPEPIKEPC